MWPITITTRQGDERTNCKRRHFVCTTSTKTVVLAFFILFLSFHNVIVLLNLASTSNGSTTTTSSSTGVLSGERRKKQQQFKQPIQNATTSNNKAPASLTPLSELTEESGKNISSAAEDVAAMCAVQKGALRYIDEWIDYHFAIGFQVIYIYDNSDNYELQDWYNNDYIMRKKKTITMNQNNDGILNDEDKDDLFYGDDGIRSKTNVVKIQHYPGYNQQKHAYTDCAKKIQLENHQHKKVVVEESSQHQQQFNIQWIAFFDLDEFLVIHDYERYPTVLHLLRSLQSNYTNPNVGGLALNWIKFYTNDQTKYEALPVTYRFRKRAKFSTDRHIKTIARTDVIEKLHNPHFVDYKKRSMYSIDTNGNQVRGPWNDHRTNDTAVVYHYFTKSWEEFKERCTRGRAGARPWKSKQHISCETNETKVREQFPTSESVFDDAPWNLLTQRVPKYAKMIT